MRSIEQVFDSGPARAAAGRIEKRGNRMTSPTSSAPAPVRLTRRGRPARVLFVMLLLMIAGFTPGRGSSQAAGHHRHVQPAVTVEAGDTLWTLAARVAPHDDP